MKKLNLGCGTDIRKGFVNLDIVKRKGVGVVHDLNKYPYPFKDNTFDKIDAIGILEHIQDFNKCIDELARISKNQAFWFVEMPYYNSYSRGRDPTHYRGCTLETFDYWTDKTKHPYDLNFKLEVESEPIGTFGYNGIIKRLSYYIGNLIDRIRFYIIVIK